MLYAPVHVVLTILEGSIFPVMDSSVQSAFGVAVTGGVMVAFDGLMELNEANTEM